MCGLTLLMGRRKNERLLETLKEDGYRGHIQRKGCRYKKLTQPQIEANHKPSKTRSRVEHIFGIQKMRAGNLIIPTIGIARTKAKIGLRNLAYNIDRYCLLAQP